MPKIVINTCFGGFGLSEEAYKKLGLEWDGYGYAYNNESKRTDPQLISVVETLGRKANGRHAQLTIVDVPDDVKWEIHDYDGVETVRERSRSWR